MILTMPQTLSGPEQEAASGSTEQLVVFLHGVGADGNDLISLAPMFAESFPDAHFCSPDAPFECDMAPYGRQWFSLQNRDPEVMLAGIQNAEPHLNQYIDAQLERFQLSMDKLIVIGFSQGTMMALYALPRRTHACAAMIGFSGAIVNARDYAAGVQSRPPVCLIHGDADMVVPHAQLANAEAILAKAAIEVEAHTRAGLGHGIDPQGIEIASDFLKKHL